MNRYRSSPLHLPRHLMLGLATVLSIPVIGLLGHLLKKSSTTQAYQVLGIVTAALTIPTLLVLLCLPRIVFVMTELITVFFLWILWTATVALTIQARNTSFGNTQCTFSGDSKTCNELSAAEAISIIIFGLLFLYLIGLFLHGTFSHHRGPGANQGVWFRRMNDRADNYSASNNAGYGNHGVTNGPAMTQSTNAQPLNVHPGTANTALAV